MYLNHCAAAQRPFIRDRLFPILPVVANWKENSVDCSRKQFPLNVAHALTIHKSQGLTLDRAVVDIRDKEMSVGLTYVALSRVRTIEDIMIFKAFDYGRLASIGNLAQVRARERFMSDMDE